MLSTRRLMFVLVVVGALAAVVSVSIAKTSHAGWPHINGKLQKAHPSGSHLKGTSRSDELLGENGSDTIDGEGGADVLWGDETPGHQNPHQHDYINGGDGDDFIYTSHGFNTVDAGAGNDTIHAHFGTGSIDCGPGIDTLFVSHKSKKHYKITGCERISFKSGG